MRNLSVLILFLLTSVVYAQPSIEEAEDFFGSFLAERAQNALFSNIIPTLEEVKLVFKDSSSLVYHQAIQQYFKAAPKTSFASTEGVFVRCEVSKFMTQDIEEGRVGYITGGMQGVRSHIKNGISFYSVLFLREKEDTSGLRYNYFTYLNGRWVMLPKPWRFLE